MLSLKLGQKIGSGRNLVTFSNKFALRFDGVDDYADISAAASEVDTAQGCFSTWVKLDTTSINAPVFKCYVNANNQITIIYLHASNQIKFMYKAAGTNTQVQGATSIEADGNYHHLALSWKVASNQLKAYIDGVQFGSTAIGFGTFAGTPSVFHIGHNALSGSDFWKGSIDEFAVFDQVKGDADIAAIYNSGTPTDLSEESGLVAYYRMEDGTGTSIADQSGNENTGTLVNGTAFNTEVP
tara:strand:- start:7767 stop:8486 length:720 start_codon:yes stop_codon:yes gene_type:complete